MTSLNNASVFVSGTSQFYNKVLEGKINALAHSQIVTISEAPSSLIKPEILQISLVASPEESIPQFWYSPLARKRGFSDGQAFATEAERDALIGKLLKTYTNKVNALVSVPESTVYGTDSESLERAVDQVATAFGFNKENSLPLDDFLPNKVKDIYNNNLALADVPEPELLMVLNRLQQNTGIWVEELGEMDLLAEAKTAFATAQALFS
jgi:hypothetical protein